MILAYNTSYLHVAGWTEEAVLTSISSANVAVMLQGGLKAVVWTDTLQTVLMYGGVAMVMILGTRKAGGLSQVIESNSQTDRLEFLK